MSVDEPVARLLGAGEDGLQVFAIMVPDGIGKPLQVPAEALAQVGRHQVLGQEGVGEVQQVTLVGGHGQGEKEEPEDEPKPSLVQECESALRISDSSSTTNIGARPISNNPV